MRTLTAFALTLALVGCASQHVRDNILFPSAITAYASIQTDIQSAGTPQDLVNAEIFGTALASHDVVQLAAAGYLWLGLRDVAERGISMRVESGEISSLVGYSLLERLEQFELTLAVLGVLTAAESG
jgi:hypothetical protein